MKHRNKLIELKRHAKARFTTLMKRYSEIPDHFFSAEDTSHLMGEIHLGHSGYKVQAAIYNSGEKLEDSQKS